MNNVKTSFLSLVDNAYGAVFNRTKTSNFEAPFLALKAVSDAQAKQITALEMQVKFLQSRVNYKERDPTKCGICGCDICDCIGG